MTIQEMKDRKRELGLSNETIAKMSGVPFSTVQKVFNGSTKAPRQKTIEALTRALLVPPNSPAQPAYPGSAPVKSQAYASKPYTSEIREEAPVYAAKKQGEYTIDDYYALPDERRVELIDGVIYDMAAPSLFHQQILGELYLQFTDCIRQHPDRKCMVYLSPCDVRLDMDNKTMVQPDLFVICRDYDRFARALDGAPELVVEILSPSTRTKDMSLKLHKYQNAGVCEYWIVDPKNQKVIVYNFADEDFIPEIYPFTTDIPVRLSGNTCKINLSSIAEEIGSQ